MTDIVGFRFDPPPGFVPEESTVGFRLAGTGRSPGPSFMVQSRPVRAGVTIETMASSILTELAQTLPEMKGASSGELTYADGGTGVLLSYNFTSGTGELRQYHALRLHEGRCCSVLLTVPLAQINDTNAKSFIAAIASVKPS